MGYVVYDGTQHQKLGFIHFSKVGHQNAEGRRLVIVDTGVTSKLGGMSPLQHLGVERVWNKQAGS